MAVVDHWIAAVRNVEQEQRTETADAIDHVRRVARLVLLAVVHDVEAHRELPFHHRSHGFGSCGLELFGVHAHVGLACEQQLLDTPQPLERDYGVVVRIAVDESKHSFAAAQEISQNAMIARVRSWSRVQLQQVLRQRARTRLVGRRC